MALFYRDCICVGKARTSSDLRTNDPETCAACSVVQSNVTLNPFMPVTAKSSMPILGLVMPELPGCLWLQCEH